MSIIILLFIALSGSTDQSTENPMTIPDATMVEAAVNTVNAAITVIDCEFVKVQIVGFPFLKEKAVARA